MMEELQRAKNTVEFAVVDGNECQDAAEVFTRENWQMEQMSQSLTVLARGHNQRSHRCLIHVAQGIIRYPSSFF